MKKPKVDRFDPNPDENHQRIDPEEVDLSGVPEIKPHQKPKPTNASSSRSPTKKEYKDSKVVKKREGKTDSSQQLEKAGSEIPKEESNDRIGSKATGRSTTQSTIRSSDQSAKQFNVVSRPKAFYITEALDERINRAVNYFKKTHGIKKADRSTVVTTILEDKELWTEEALSRLVDRLVNQLARR